MFIIDPLYSLPLLLGLIVAAVARELTWGLRANALGLLVSTVYLAWSALAQASVADHARQSLAAAGLPSAQLLVTPAPLQTQVWRVVALDGDRYHEGYYALRDQGRPIRFRAFDRGGHLLARHAGHVQVQRLQRFADGFVAMRQEGADLWITDLRMGQQPYYVFDFNIGAASADPAAPPPAQQVSARIPLAAGFKWLGRRMAGEDIDPPGR
jgi:inner membrane protein